MIILAEIVVTTLIEIMLASNTTFDPSATWLAMSDYNIVLK